MRQITEASLIDFYRSYAEWLDSGAPDRRPYDHDGGLCHSLRVWYMNVPEKSPHNLYSYRSEMQRHFVLERLDITFPFGMKDFYKRMSDYTMHLCPKRALFVRERIRKHDEELARESQHETSP